MIQGKRLNYVIATWAGGRRVRDPRCPCPGAYYLRRHFLSLINQPHDLDQITVVIPECPGTPQEFWDTLKELPRRVGKAEVVCVYRENGGFSYGSWSSAYGYYRNDFDYYFFMEDDYQFCQDNFDHKMVSLIEELPQCGFLAGQCWEIRGIYPFHAGMSCGIAKAEALEKAVRLHGHLPYERGLAYRNGENSQVILSRGISIDVGYNLFDVRSRYRIVFRQPDFRIDFHHAAHLPAILDVI